MASKNQKLPVPVPVAGVRRDFDALAMPAEGLEHGQNVIVRRGVLVPRACNEAMNWFSGDEWGLLYGTSTATAIAYEAANTRHVLARSDGNLVVTDDEFATTENHTFHGGVSGSYTYFIKIIHDATNNRWIGLDVNGSIWTAVEAWPDSGQWTRYLNGNDGAAVDMVHDVTSGTTIALLSVGGAEQPSIYWSTNGTTWTVVGYSRYGHSLYGDSEIGYGGHSKPNDYFYLKTRKDANTDYLLAIIVGEIDNAGIDFDEYETGTHRVDFCGGGNNTLCIYDDGEDNWIQRSTNSGDTWTTVLGAGLAYTGDRFKRLFYDSTLGYLLLGGDNYRSLDAADWTQYPDLSFGTESIIDAISDGTDWYIVSDAGVWKFPSNDDDTVETIVSMYQF
ncbi:hypothetical protein DRQ25_18155, partial [Candidatus Fermentibacteria bacterium]